MGLKKHRLDAYIEDVASATPTPGGGSVAAICGSLSAALVRMVAGLAIGKEEYSASQKELERICDKSLKLQSRLIELAGEDSDAYEAVIEAIRMSKATPAKKAKREEEMRRTLRTATEVPLETMNSCLEVLKLAKDALEKGSRSAFTDAATATLLANASLKAASMNVMENLSSIKDSKFQKKIVTKLQTILKESSEVTKEINDYFSKRL